MILIEHKTPKIDHPPSYVDPHPWYASFRKWVNIVIVFSMFLSLLHHKYMITELNEPMINGWTLPGIPW
jgi:hypothetical protein